MGCNRWNRRCLNGVWGDKKLKEKEDKEIIFKGRVIRQTYDGGDYKIYALDVDKEIYPEIKFTKYGNATITGMN